MDNDKKEDTRKGVYIELLSHAFAVLVAIPLFTLYESGKRIERQTIEESQ